MSTWQKIKRGIKITLAASGVFLAALLCHQPTVYPPPLPIEQVAPTEWVTTNVFHDSVTVDGKQYSITIKPGFSFDMASIPKRLEIDGITRDTPAIRRGALLHDALFRSHSLDMDVANQILYQCCLDDGMVKEKADAVFEAVSAWSWVAWDSVTPESVVTARGLVSVR